MTKSELDQNPRLRLFVQSPGLRPVVLFCPPPQLLRAVTISNGGVLPRIHPELLSKKRGGRVKVEPQVIVAEKTNRGKGVKRPPGKRNKGKPGRKPKVWLFLTHTHTHKYTHTRKYTHTFPSLNLVNQC